ncbi:TadE/TadG family type IV pilus assembly protein [Halodurantibacterium flavum]|uniref:TadE/TadG family type IV pilus assembly protein n=1 Tax=Halodurantibacterium flavum TaxID=1382802 RepID=A0ABW4S697_9RHOB
MMTLLRRILRCGSGAAGVEFALVCVPLVALIVGIVELGRALNLRNELAYAADQGVRILLMQQGSSAAEEAVRQGFSFGGSEDLQVSVVTASGSQTLVVSYPLDLIVPGLNKTPISLRIERKLTAP